MKLEELLTEAELTALRSIKGGHHSIQERSTETQISSTSQRRQDEPRNGKEMGIGNSRQETTRKSPAKESISAPWP